MVANAPTIVSPTPPGLWRRRYLVRVWHRSSKFVTNRRLCSFPTEPIASRKTALSESASRVESNGSKQSGSTPSSRAASTRVRWHSAPVR